jgi:hypothetical protein
MLAEIYNQTSPGPSEHELRTTRPPLSGWFLPFKGADVEWKGCLICSALVKQVRLENAANKIVCSHKERL